MTTRRRLAVVLLLAVVNATTVAASEVRLLGGIKTWAAYYGSDREAASELARFDLVALDPAGAPLLGAVKRHGSLVVMYVSLGEVNTGLPAYSGIQGESWVLDTNPNWPDARKLDVRAPAYLSWLLSKVVAPALAGPVNGLFLDTADTAIELEREQPQKFGGMTVALETVLKTLRAKHPRALLVLNGGLPLVERAPALVDAVAVESVWTDFDFATKRYRRREAADARERAARLDRLVARGVPVFVLEYAEPTDRPWIDTLIQRARDHRFVPYVSTIGLDRVFTFTLR